VQEPRIVHRRATIRPLVIVKHSHKEEEEENEREWYAREIN
jgi:hypothetical protein